MSKDELHVCFLQLDSQQKVSIKGSRKFSNTLSGWKGLDKWTAKFRKDPEIPFVAVVEATGVYYEGFAYFFKDQGYKLHVLLPNKAKYYARSLNVKTKNDQVDAGILGRLGLERNLSEWKGMSENMQKIKHLCRQRTALLQMSTAVKNQLHAHTYCRYPQKAIIKSMHQHLYFLDKQIEQIEAELQKIYAQDPDLKQRVDNICLIKGLGIITVLCVIAETNAFDLIQNKAQLVSYAGYDVVEQSSGTSVKRKTHISKKGNSHIRRALYFPAISAAIHEPKLKELYERIHLKNPKIKMIGAVAVQRKLLVLIYTLYKNNKPYDPNYQNAA